MDGGQWRRDLRHPPWKTFGEGPTKASSGHFKENTAYTPQDIRFTAKDGALYAITLGTPGTTVRMQSWAARSDWNAAR